MNYRKNRYSAETKKLWSPMVVSLGFVAAILCGLASSRLIHAQSALTTFYTSGEAWDCAGAVASCPKPIAAVDGQNKLFPLRSVPAGSAALDVYLNGLWERPCKPPNVGACGYTEVLNAANSIIGITMTVAPAGQSGSDPVGDQLDLRYRGNFRGNVQPQ